MGDGGGPAEPAAEPPALQVPPVTDPAVLDEVRARRDEVPWRGWDAAGIALLYLLGSIPLYAFAPAAAEAEAHPVPLLDSALLLAAALLWLALVRGRAALRHLAARRDAAPRLPRTLALAAAVGIAWPLLDTALYVLLESAGVAFPPMQEHLQDWIDQPATRVLVALDIVLLTPVAEEVVFRGVLFQGLARRWGVGVAAVASSLLFGLAHVESAGADSVFLAGSTFLFGLAAAWLLRRRGTLLAPVAAHVVTNAIATAGLLAS